MTHIIKQFNNIVADLLEQTTDLIGQKYLFNFTTIIRFNVAYPIDKFIINMLPLKNHIMAKNIDYFMNGNIDSLENNISNNDIIDLKQIFKNIDKHSQENIWEILQALIILCEERVANKPTVKYSFY